jgi:hypothetical protein
VETPRRDEDVTGTTDPAEVVERKIGKFVIAVKPKRKFRGQQEQQAMGNIKESEKGVCKLCRAGEDNHA